LWTPDECPEARDLVFVTEFGKKINLNSLVYKHFKPILRRAGLPKIRERHNGNVEAALFGS
jgi:hypothetical protein